MRSMEPRLEVDGATTTRWSIHERSTEVDIEVHKVDKEVDEVDIEVDEVDKAADEVDIEVDRGQWRGRQRSMER
jgi:hypothetical protein